jgi:transcription elongation factor Elf1
MLDTRPLDDEGIDGWRVARIRCRFCGHEWISVFPVEADDRSLECSQCHICESEVLIDYPPTASEE